MSTVSWATPETIGTILSTELNSLANGGYSAASGVIDNAAGLYMYMSVVIDLATLTPTAGAYLALYLLPAIDGSSYEDGGGATAPPNGSVIATFDLSTSAGAKKRARTNILIPPYKFKLVLLNGSGVALNASTNTLQYARHNEAVI